MSRQGVGPKISREDEARLWADLNQKATELGKFEIFRPSGPQGTVSPEAQRAAFQFAAAYGRCKFAGLDLEWEHFFPAEVLPSVAMAVAAGLASEYNLLVTLKREFTLHPDDTVAKRQGFARRVVEHYMDIAAAHTTMQEVVSRYADWIEQFVPRDERDQARFQNSFLREAGKASLVYKNARQFMSRAEWHLQNYIKADLAQLKETIVAEYRDVLEPLIPPRWR